MQSREFPSGQAIVAASIPQNMKISPQQEAFLRWIEEGGKGESAFLEAVAGAGKTTTLILAQAKTTGSVAFAAYNKKIATEIDMKVKALNLGNRIQVATFHSFGFRAWRQANPSCRLDDRGEKTKQANSYLSSLRVPEELFPFVARLVSFAKNKMLGLDGNVGDVSQWYDIISHHDLSHDLDVKPKQGITIENGIEAAIKSLEFQTGLAPRLIDFDDMLYMPALSGVKVYENDWLFVDEAQDTNPSRRALARKMLKKDGRSCWVGDRAQAIYGFTGADNDAIDKIISEFDCVSFPLTTTYRCPKAVVAEAQTIVSHIQAHESAPEGHVSAIDFSEFMKKENTATLTAQDAILCRLTKPLVSLAYELIKRDIGCHVEGRDIGTELVKLINRWKNVRTLSALRECLEIYADVEGQKLIAKGRETAAEALRDRVATVLVIMDGSGVSTREELIRKIEGMFVDGEYERKKTLTLSTIHKSKGREWQKVFILGRNDYMPSPYARQEWQKEQELHLCYVAITRSMDKLIMINGVKNRSNGGEHGNQMPGNS